MSQAQEVKSSDADCLVLLSGGPDSTTLLHHLIKKENKKPLGLYFQVGSDSSKSQFTALNKFVKEFGTEIMTFGADELVNLHFVGSDLLNGFTDAISFGVVVALAQAASIASAKGLKQVYVGFHKGDRSMVPTGSEELLNALCRMYGVDVSIISPFSDYTKAQVFEYGIKLGVKLEDTISCTRMTGDKVCNECGACKMRKEAMDAISKKDY